MDLCYNIREISYVQYLYTQINNNLLQRELFNNMFGTSLYSVTVTTGPLRGSHDADTPALLYLAKLWCLIN